MKRYSATALAGTQSVHIGKVRASEIAYFANLGRWSVIMVMWTWRRIRRANIPNELRDRFEVYGENVLALMLSTGDVHTTQGASLQRLELIDLVQQRPAELVAWLQERADTHERREDRLEAVEWAILIAVIVGVLADCAIVAHELRFGP